MATDALARPRSRSTGSALVPSTGSLMSAANVLDNPTTIFTVSNSLTGSRLTAPVMGEVDQDTAKRR